MREFDRHFCKYVQTKAKGSVKMTFTLLVDAIGHGNGDYIKELCRLLGYPKDMLKVSQAIVSGNWNRQPDKSK